MCLGVAMDGVGCMGGAGRCVKVVGEELVLRGACGGGRRGG